MSLEPSQANLSRFDDGRWNTLHTVDSSNIIPIGWGFFYTIFSVEKEPSKVKHPDVLTLWTVNGK